jgi:NADPH:quinone reductase
VRAVLIDNLSGITAARLGDAPEPEAPHHRARGQRLLIDVKATGLSAIDVLQANGAYQYGTPPPYVTGSEIAGVVLEADPASGFVPGDHVGSIVFWGGMAERAVAAPEYTVPLPRTMPFDEGAAVYMNYSTAWYAYHRAGVRPGQTVLLHGGAGGVGTAVADLADVFGATVIAVVSSDEKAELATQAGAAHVLRADGPWPAQVRELTEGRGVHAVFDPVGGDRFTDSLRSLRIGGIVVVIGFVGGSIPQVKVNRLLLRNLTVTGISMDSMDTEFPGTLTMVRDAVAELLQQGRIHPRIGRVFPFEQGAEALASLQDRTALGKIVVTGPSA